MKKVLSMILLLTLIAVLFVGCGEKGEKEEVPDLIGEWSVKNDDGEEGMTMMITSEYMEINWASDDTSALYWAGTFTPPTKSGEYKWTSTNDKSKTDTAILASGDDTKEFTYADGVISFDVSMMGVTQTMHAEKVK